MNFEDKLTEALKVINEEKWSQDVDVEEGKMHKLLNVPEGEDIKDHYTSGEKLAKDLLNAVAQEEGEDDAKQSATGMIAFAANVNSEDDIYDEALQEIEDLEVDDV